MIRVVSITEFEPSMFALSIGLDVVPEGCMAIEGVTLTENLIALAEHNEKWCSDNLVVLLKNLYQQGIKALQMFKDTNIALVYKNTVVGSAFSQLV